MLLLGCVGFGYMENLKWKIRLEQVRKLKELLMLLQNEITYKYATLGEACLFLSSQRNTAFGDLLKEIYLALEEGKEFYPVWKATLEEWRKENYLMAEDIRPAVEFANISTVSDIKLQAGLIELSVKELEERMEYIKKEYERKGKTYVSLGFLTGFMGIILLL